MGQHDYQLKSLADDQLLAGLSNVVGRRREITAEFLAYLAELDERQIFLDLGFASLFEYCVEALGLCESTAGRHIAAARVCRSHPQVFAMVASGALHASALSLLRKHLTLENAEELFELCRRRSARQVEVLLAARFPKPDVRDLVRRLPAKAGLTLDVGSDSAKVPTEAPSRESSTDLEAAAVESLAREPPATSSTAEAPKARRLEPLSADRYGVHFTADGEFRELLERVRGLAGHRLPNGDLLTLIRRGLEAYERELTKERFAVGTKPRRNRGVASASAASAASAAASAASAAAAAAAAADLPASEPPNPSTPEPLKPDTQSNPNLNRKRHHSAAVTRAVFLRDGKQCSYVSPDGRRCSSRRCLELDHVDPWAVGGESTIENLRLRCRAHNQRYARQYYGKARVEAAVQRSRRRREAAERSGKR